MLPGPHAHRRSEQDFPVLDCGQRASAIRADLAARRHPQPGAPPRVRETLAAELIAFRIGFNL